MEEQIENVIEETTEVNEPKGMETKGDVTKVIEKMKMKPMVEEQTITKIDLNNPPKTKEDEQPVDSTETERVQEKVVEETTNQEEITEQTTEELSEKPVVEEVTNEEEKVEDTVEPVVETTESKEIEKELPESVQKLVDFMEDTGGDLNDYVKLNKDYDELDNLSLLEEYYSQTKPHLNREEINFLMEDRFSYNEDVDDKKDIQRKKLALKEQVASAKSHLDGQKSKYYEDIKSGSKLTSEQQKAIDFFDRYSKESEESNEVVKKQQSNFLNKTDTVFNDKFKGFEYSVGDKKFRFNIKNTSEVKKTQSDINNFVGKFLNKDKLMEDAKGYHKSLFTAMNADTIANHFYEQGKADAMKNSFAESKNVNMDPRQSHGTVEAGGIKFKVLGDNSSDFKFKIKNK